MDASVPRLGQRYLLVINIPFFTTSGGETLFDELWLKDLQLHRTYLDDLRLASPARSSEPPANALPLVDARGLGRIRVVPLPDMQGTRRAILQAPRTLARLWKAVGEADVVHAGVAGEPYPLGWPAAVFARMRGKFLVVNVESAPWRTHGPGAGWKRKLREAVSERLARMCVRLADLPMFTQEGYRDTLLGPGRPGYVGHATWIDGDAILSDAAADAAWDAKSAQPLRAIFAGRLAEAKGLAVLREAVRLLAARGAPVVVDVMGEGPERDACAELEASLGGPTRLRLVPPRPYGPAFFEAIRPYHVLVAPALTDEQPRIIYDAYSQALPVVASDTAGNRSCTFDGRTGLIVPVGDPAALAGVLQRLLDEPARAREMGTNALALARSSTHAAMHARRACLLADLLETRRTLAEALDRDARSSPTREFLAAE